jgi:hypothetical protein
VQDTPADVERRTRLFIARQLLEIVEVDEHNVSWWFGHPF